MKIKFHWSIIVQKAGIVSEFRIMLKNYLNLTTMPPVIIQVDRYELPKIINFMLSITK